MTALDPLSPGYRNPHGHNHACGQVGKTVTSPTPEPAPQGRPKSVELTRSMRYWIQHRLEQIGEANLDPMERRLLEKVRL